MLALRDASADAAPAIITQPVNTAVTQGQPVTLQQQAETFARLAEFCRRLEGHTHMGLGRTPRVPWIVRVWRAILSA